MRSLFNVTDNKEIIHLSTEQTNGTKPESAGETAQPKEILMSKNVTTTATFNVLSSTIVQQLDALSAKRQQWETNAYKKASDELYDLLAECVDIYMEKFQTASEKDKKALRSELIGRLQADGIRVLKTSTTLTMLARFVFNSDRKRAHGYGYVIAAAVSHGVTGRHFPAWIAQQGGIEEVKRLMVKKAESIAKQNAVNAAKDMVKGEIELNEKQPMAQVALSGFKGSYAVLLTRPNPLGGLDIVGSLDDVNDALVNALILRMAKASVEAAAADKALGEQVQRESNDLLASTNDYSFNQVVNA
jgi:hypothetical protein